MINEVLVYDGEKLFFVQVMKVELFHKMLCALQVCPTDTTRCIMFNSLQYHGVLNLKKISGLSFIIEKDYCFKGLWCML